MSAAGTFAARTLFDGQEPRALVRELASQGVSGELCFTNGIDRATVYFQSGRIAWANDTLHRRIFVDRLRETAGIQQSDVDAVVEDCRKTRRPIGETLVSWKLATPEQVRDALRNQIALALFEADQLGDPHPRFERHDYGGTHDDRFTFAVPELVPTEDAHPPCDVVQLHPAQDTIPDDRADAAAGTSSLTEGVAMSTVTEKLKELQQVDGFSGAAVFTPAGEALAMLEGDAPKLKEVGILANAVLINAQKASLEMGAGRGQVVHVEGERAQVLVRCLNEGNDPLKSLPGKAHIHLVMVMKQDAAIGLAKLRVDGVIQKLAEHFR